MFERGGRLLPSTRRALAIIPIWFASSLWMWLWWLHGHHIPYLWLYIPLTAAILYEYAILPTSFLYFLLRAKKPRLRKAQSGKKVAVITLCVPSTEAQDIIENQLKAMADITYPHDSWILDEGDSKEVKRLARKYGIKYFTRKGVRKYNQPNPPFKAKTKAGNVNAWIEHVKRRKYDFFVQLDIDHIPKPNYLDKTLGFFRDENIAWVQAPSVYKNLEHWTARGAAELELVFQGPLQMGFYGHSETPFIIGSHSTYRMTAVREIGGFQPTRAEDHLDTVALASKGWKGVFLPEIIAEGDGPETLNTYLNQHFAWAYSMFQVLIHHSPTLLKTMPLKRKIQFLFAQTWYPLWCLSYMTMFFVPLIALAINRPVMSISGGAFLSHFLPMFTTTFLIWWAAKPIMQPHNLRLSWRGILLHAARWPIILRAITSAAFRVKKPYMITPKGKFAHSLPTTKLYMPFLILGFLSCIDIGFASHAYGYRSTSNQMFFAFMNVLFAIIVCTVDLDLRMRQSTVKLQNFRLEWLKPVAAVMTLLIMSAVLVSSTVIEQGVSYAIATSKPRAEAVDLSVIPPAKLTDKQLIEQISDNQYDYAGRPAPQVGVYDPARRLRTSQGYVRHTFVDWRDSRMLSEQLLISERLGATPLITLEPRGQDNGQVLLDDIAAGKYDAQLEKTFSIMSDAKGPVYVRFAHEMDLAELYPWGSQDPANFIAAYRHTVELARTQGDNNIKWVWSPAGNANAAAYYPGDDVVDVVGTTILYDQYWYYDYHPSFEQLSSGRHWLLSYGKPVWIVEFGVGKADPDFQRVLIQDALTHYKDYGYGALVYLNIKDSNIFGPDYQVSDMSDFGDYLKPATKPALALLATKPIKPKPFSSAGTTSGKGASQTTVMSLNLNIGNKPIATYAFSAGLPIAKHQNSDRQYKPTVASKKPAFYAQPIKLIPFRNQKLQPVKTDSLEAFYSQL